MLTYLLISGIALAMVTCRSYVQRHKNWFIAFVLIDIYWVITFIEEILGEL